MSAPVLTTLPSGRTVLDTGKVLIGLQAAPRAAALGQHAERLQSALLQQQGMAPAEPARLGMPSREDLEDAEELMLWQARMDADALEWIGARLARLRTLALAIVGAAALWAVWP